MTLAEFTQMSGIQPWDGDGCYMYIPKMYHVKNYPNSFIIDICPENLFCLSNYSFMPNTPILLSYCISLLSETRQVVNRRGEI